MGPDGAACFHTLSKDSRDVKKADWDIERMGMICETTAVFTNFKEVIDSLCQNTGQCSYEVKQQEAAFFSKVKSQSLRSHPAATHPPVGAGGLPSPPESLSHP